MLCDIITTYQMITTTRNLGVIRRSAKRVLYCGEWRGLGSGCFVWIRGVKGMGKVDRDECSPKVRDWIVDSAEDSK